MKLRNELEHVVLADSRGRSVEGVVRVRGIDARFAGRGLILQSQEPVAVLLRSPAGVSRMAMPAPSLAPAAAMMAAPALYLAVSRILRKGRRR
jgi:hypothetical protein